MQVKHVKVSAGLGLGGSRAFGLGFSEGGSTAVCNGVAASSLLQRPPLRLPPAAPAQGRTRRRSTCTDACAAARTRRRWRARSRLCCGGPGALRHAAAFPLLCLYLSGACFQCGSRFERVR